MSSTRSSPTGRPSRVVCLALYPAFLLLACGRSGPPEKRTPTEEAPPADSGATRPTAPVAAPPLPVGVFLQITHVEQRVVDRFTDDGRWLRAKDGGPETQQTPIPQRPRGPLVPPGEVERLKAAIAAAGLARLPGRIPADPDLSSGRVQLTSGRRFQPGTVIVTVPAGRGGALAIEVKGDLQAPGSFGPLSGLMKAVDRAAYGGFMNE